MEPLTFPKQSCEQPVSRHAVLGGHLPEQAFGPAQGCATGPRPASKEAIEKGLS